MRGIRVALLISAMLYAHLVDSMKHHHRHRYLSTLSTGNQTIPELETSMIPLLTTERSIPCLQSPCAWDTRDTDVDIVDDRDGLVTTYFSLLLSESQKENEKKWLSEIENFEHSTAIRPLMAHEFVASRSNYSLGFSPANLTCLLNRSGPFPDFTQITSASIERILPERIDVAMLNDTQAVKCGYYARASLWRNGTITYEKQVASDMLRTIDHSPSAAFLEHSAFSLANKVLYDLSVYKNIYGTWSEIATPPFFRSGGENIGSFFSVGNDTYASVRFTVPYSPSMNSGMGFRSMGIYKVGIKDSSAVADVHVDVNARAWIAPDQCVSACKGTQMEGKRCEPRHIIMNATNYARCEKAVLAEMGVNLPAMDKCIVESIIASPADDCTREKTNQLVRLVRCVNDCRVHNQIYQASISTINGRLYTVFGPAFYYGADQTSPPSNPIHFCALSNDFIWDKDCFETDSTIFFDPFGKFGHPIPSQMVQYDGSYFLVMPAAREGAASTSNCSVYLRQWDEKTFSFVQVKKENTAGQVVLKKFRLPASGKISVVCQSKAPGKQCDDGLQISGVPSASCPQASLCQGSKTGMSEVMPGFVKVEFSVTCGCAATSPVELKIDFKDWHKIYALM